MLDPELMAAYTELQRAAAESRVGLYTVLLERGRATMWSEVKSGRTSTAEPRSRKRMGSPPSPRGPAGCFSRGSARAVGVFDRIESEVTSFYQLGLESSPADADGKQHDVKVRVNRAGVDVRAPSHIAVDASRPRQPRRAIRWPLALQQPTDVPDVPLADHDLQHPSGRQAGPAA